MKLHSLGTACVVLAGLLTSCGGGGGGNTPPPPANLNSAPGEAALINYVMTEHQKSLYASNGGTTYNLEVDSVPNGGTTTFNGAAPAASRVETVTLNENGGRVANSISTAYFLLNPYVPLGEVSSTGSPYGVVTSSSPVPTTLTVGNSGAFYTQIFYHDSMMSVIDANVTVTYSVRANNSTTLLWCLDSTVSDVTAQGAADGLADGTEYDCYIVDAEGNATLVSVTMTVNNVTLMFH